ncbi:uncharacterized protein ACBR49_001670 [Aulostomus maculatus]
MNPSGTEAMAEDIGHSGTPAEKGKEFPQKPAAEKDQSEDDRRLYIPSCFLSDSASAISSFCIGVLWGAPGGLLLGGVASFLRQPLELLIKDHKPSANGAKYTVLYIMSANVHGVFSFALSLFLACIIGLITYAQLTHNHSEKARGEVLGLTGSVSLMVLTVTGCSCGFLLQYFLEMSLEICIFMLLITTLAAAFVFWKVTEYLTHHHFPLRYYLFTAFCAQSAGLITCALNWLLKYLHNDESSAILEYLFFGTFTPVLLLAAVGKFLFVSLQPGGEPSISVAAAAVATGAAVLGAAAKVDLTWLGPGPIIGAVIGVGGAVGVALTAAEVSVETYGAAGKLGLAAGAAAGAFLASHNELPRSFVAAAATLTILLPVAFSRVASTLMS